MKKKNEKVYIAVLDKAFEQTMNNLSKLDFNAGDENLGVSFEDYFEDTLANLQLISENSNEKSTAYAEAFALHSINVIAQTREIQSRIDEFFTSSDNQHFFEENGIADDEKSAVCQELKDFISNMLEIKCNSKEESDFVEKVNAIFDSGKEKPIEYLTHSVDFVSNVNKHVNGDNAKDALNAAYNEMSFLEGENEIKTAIFEGISSISESVNKEKIDEYNKDIFANYISENATKVNEIKENEVKENETKVNEAEGYEVNAKMFMEHFAADPNSLTLGDKKWAETVYERMLSKTDDLDDIEYTSFMANGEQIISDEEFENAVDKNGILIPEKHAEMVAKLAEKVASGAEITVKYTVPKPVEVDISDVKTDEIGWENEIYKRLLAQANEPNIDYTSFMANGEQIISNEELENAKDEKGVISPEKRVEIEEKIAGKVVRGEEVGVKSTAEKPLKINVSKITVYQQPIKTYTFPEIEAAEPVKDAPENTEVNAKSFSEHFAADPNNLTPDEKEWAKKVYSRLTFNASNLENVKNFDGLDFTSYLADGKQIISNEEIRNARDEKGAIPLEKRDAFRERIAAKVASGAEITVKNAPQKPIVVDLSKIKVGKNPEMAQNSTEKKAAEPVKTAPTKENTAAKTVASQPTIPNRTIVFTKGNQIKPMSFGQFMNQLMKNIVNLIKEAIGLDKDKSKSNEKNASSTRVKTDFNELVKKEAEASGKKLPTEKTYEKTNEKVNEKTNEKTLTQNGLAR